MRDTKPYPRCAYLLLLSSLALISGTSCTHVGRNLGSGLAQGIEEAHLDSLAGEVAARATGRALAAIGSDSVAVVLQSRLGGALSQTSDSLQALADSLRERLIGTYTEHWIKGLTRALGDSLTTTAVELRNELLGEQTRLGLRRAQGAEGRLDRGTTPFPVHMVLEFDS